MMLGRPSFPFGAVVKFFDKSSPRYSGVKNLIHEILILIGFLRNETLRSKRVPYFILQHKRKPNQGDFLFHCSHLISTPFFTFFFIFACDCGTKSEPPKKYGSLPKRVDENYQGDFHLINPHGRKKNGSTIHPNRNTKNPSF